MQKNKAEKSSQYDLVNGNVLTILRCSSPGASSMSIYRNTDKLVDSIVEFHVVFQASLLALLAV